MDFQKIADAFYTPTCVVSVERLREGGYGEIRLVAGNRRYVEMVDTRIEEDNDRVAVDKGSSFVPGSLYTDYFPLNRSFEGICYRAAVKKTEGHTYAHLNTSDIWFDIYALPLDYQDGNTYYCTYTVNPDKNADVILETAGTTRTSRDVLRTCIKLHKADNIKDAMKNVISEIRRICKAEGCTLLLMNYDEAQYSIMATDYIKASTIKRVTQFNDFFVIADSWEKMIGEEGDCAIIKDDADMEYYSRVNNPWYLTLVEAGVKSVVLFPLRQAVRSDQVAVPMTRRFALTAYPRFGRGQIAAVVQNAVGGKAPSRCRQNRDLVSSAVPEHERRSVKDGRDIELQTAEAHQIQIDMLLEPRQHQISQTGTAVIALVMPHPSAQIPKQPGKNFRRPVERRKTHFHAGKTGDHQQKTGNAAQLRPENGFEFRLGRQGFDREMPGSVNLFDPLREAGIRPAVASERILQVDQFRNGFRRQSGQLAITADKIVLPTRARPFSGIEIIGHSQYLPKTRYGVTASAATATSKTQALFQKLPPRTTDIAARHII